jgi:glycerophosphoryl diester phosphodiesterase
MSFKVTNEALAPPLVIAHRGASGLSPENTLASFELARLLGASGVELDVQLSADGLPVVIHDYTVERTTSGAGRVSELTARQLAGFDAGGWFERRLALRPRARKHVEAAYASAHTPRPAFAGERIPTLESALALLAQARFDRVYVELKTLKMTRNALLDSTLRLVRQFGLQRSVVLLSFDHEAIGLARAEAPDIRSAITIPAGKASLLTSRAITKAAGRAGADEVALHFSLASRGLVRALHAHGLSVSAWTVNRRIIVPRLVGCGVDSIITNFPNRLLDAIESSPGSRLARRKGPAKE